MHLHVHLGIGTVHHMKDDIAVPGLLKRTSERFYQVVGKLSDEQKNSPADIFFVGRYKPPHELEEFFHNRECNYLYFAKIVQNTIGTPSFPQNLNFTYCKDDIFFVALP